MLYLIFSRLLSRLMLLARASSSKDIEWLVLRLWVPESRRMSCDLLILVDEPAEAVVSFDLVDLGWCATGEWS